MPVSLIVDYEDRQISSFLANLFVKTKKFAKHSLFISGSGTVECFEQKIRSKKTRDTVSLFSLLLQKKTVRCPFNQFLSLSVVYIFAER